MSQKPELSSKYRFSLLNEQTMESYVSFELTARNIVLLWCALFVTIGSLIIGLVVFTPIKYYIPGYGDAHFRHTVLVQQQQIDSLMQANNRQFVFLQQIKYLIKGNMDSLHAQTPMGTESIDTLAPAPMPDGLNIPSTAEMQLRTFMEANDTISADTSIAYLSVLEEMELQTPLQGPLNEAFDAANAHFGVDILSEIPSPIVAMANGTVILSDWTKEAGFVIGIQHINNIISLYKHNDILLKKVGTFVHQGDTIAMVGAKESPNEVIHLHFELWYNQIPLNPANYINFEPN